MRIVCNLERPSELSWRARHGRKKKWLAIAAGSASTSPHLFITKARLAIVAGPAQLSSFHCLFHISFLHHYHLGPACHCGRSRRGFTPPSPGPFLSLTTPTLPLSYLLLVATPRALAAMGDPTVILLTLCHNESTSDPVGTMLFNDYKFAFTEESGGASFSRT